jgi:type III secretion protein SpaR/YscT/HrcT
MDFASPSLQLVDYLFGLGLACARIFGFLTVFPLTTAQFFPVSARNGLAIVIGAFLLPQILPIASTLKADTPLLVLLAIKEVAIGALFGFALGTLVWTFEAVGALVEFQSGSANSQVFDPLSGSETGLLSKLFVQLALVLFLAFGGFEMFLRVLMDSYSAWPADQWAPKFTWVAQEIGATIGKTFWLILFQYGISAIICTYMVDIFFGVSGKYAPQLNLFQFSLPFKSAAILLILVAVLPSILTSFEGNLKAIIELLSASLAVR